MRPAVSYTTDQPSPLTTRAMAAERKVLPRPGSPVRSRLPAVLGEGLRVAPADLQDPGHVLPGRDAQRRIVRIGVPAEGKGLKALAAQIQHPAQLLLLLPGIVFAQAPAHLSAPIPGVPAQGAGGLLLQRILRQSHLGQQAALFLLEAQVLLPEHLHRRQRVGAPAKGGGDDAAHGGAQLPLDLTQPGLAEENGLPPGLEPLLTLLAGPPQTSDRPGAGSYRHRPSVTPPCPAAGCTCASSSCRRRRGRRPPAGAWAGRPAGSPPAYGAPPHASA